MQIFEHNETDSKCSLCYCCCFCCCVCCMWQFPCHLHKANCHTTYTEICLCSNCLCSALLLCGGNALARVGQDTHTARVVCCAQGDKCPDTKKGHVWPGSGSGLGVYDSEGSLTPPPHPPRSPKRKFVFGFAKRKRIKHPFSVAASHLHTLLLSLSPSLSPPPSATFTCDILLLKRLRGARLGGGCIKHTPHWTCSLFLWQVKKLISCGRERKSVCGRGRQTDIKQNPIRRLIYVHAGLGLHVPHATSRMPHFSTTKSNYDRKMRQLQVHSVTWPGVNLPPFCPCHCPSSPPPPSAQQTKYSRVYLLTLC